MDNLDVRILGVLLGGDPASPNFRPPFRGVARQLGVDENTVRKRLEKLRASGFLKAWLVAVNPRVLGLGVAQVWAEVGHVARKQEALQQISLVDGVALVLDYFGGAIGIHLYHGDQRELHRRLALISRITGTSGVEVHELSFPDPGITLGRTDWRIVRSLQHNPWKSYVRVANEVGTTSTTIKRRLARLNRTKALFLLAQIDPRAAEGSLLCHLFVSCESSSDRARIDGEIRRQLSNELAFAELDDPEFAFYALHLSKLYRVSQLRTWMESLPGVRRAKLELLESVIPCPGVQEAFVEAALGAR